MPPISATLPRSSQLWSIGTLLICFLVAAPIVAVLIAAFGDNQQIWSHLWSSVLPTYTKTTLSLMGGVAIGTLLIGICTAWLVTMCEFPGRRIFEWALLLPLAMPAYIGAFVYTDLLEYAGPVQTAIRDWFGFVRPSDYWFPEIRSLSGAIAMMVLTLYPYVYLLTRAAFMEQNVAVMEASRTLGCSPWGMFFKVSLPLARPGFIVGVALVLMETLNDFGTVEFFAVQTFSAAIYDVWLNMNSLSGAAQISLVMLTLVIALAWIEKAARGSRGFHSSTEGTDALPRYGLSSPRSILAVFACALPVLLGFVVPAIVLARYALVHYEATLEANYGELLTNSLTLAGLAAVIAVVIGVFLASGVRYSGSKVQRIASRLAAGGYAVPGAILAVGILVTLAGLDRLLSGLLTEYAGITAGLIFSGTIAAVTYGYVVRFLALSFGSAQSSLTRIKPSMEDAARTMGTGRIGTLMRLHFPLIRASLVAALLLVFVDCMKELPMTVILRPFNFETLATFVFQYASDELLEEASLAALTIVAAGVIPVLMLSSTLSRSRQSRLRPVNR